MDEKTFSQGLDFSKTVIGSVILVYGILNNSNILMVIGGTLIAVSGVQINVGGMKINPRSKKFKK